MDAFTTLVWFGAVISEEGLDSPSLRRIARDRCSPGTLLNWFGSKAGLHQRVLRTLGVKWGHSLSGSLVPVSDAARFYARLRLAYEELARTDAALAAGVDELANLEREIIAWWLGSTHQCASVDPRVITVVHALLMRLWDDRVHPDPRAALVLLEEVINACVGKPVIADAFVPRG